MGCVAELQLYAESESIAKNTFKTVEADVIDVEKKYSRYLADSIISKINSSAGVESQIVDEETSALFDYAKTCYEQSDGLFDLTSGVLRRVWDFRSKSIPTQSQIDEILPLVGWDKIKWQRPEIFLTKKNMEIDFGGIGKEYAVDRASKVFLDHGATSALVNLGGDVRIIGTRPDGASWHIGIIHPRKANAAIGSLLLNHGAVATSGDYERFIEISGNRYCHILNPKTGWPAQDFQSVSVVSDSCLIAGTASTIAMLKGNDLGQAFLKNLELPYLIVSSDGIESNVNESGIKLT